MLPTSAPTTGTRRSSPPWSGSTRSATPENAARLERGRQLNAVVGLVGAPLILAGLIGWGFFHWRRFGKDPVYLDSPSIYVPAPPPDLTAASGAMVMDGGTSRRALTTAMLDLASRGLIAFREESGILGLRPEGRRRLDPASGDEIVEAQRARNGRRPIGPAEQLALRRLHPIGTDNYIEPDELLKFGAAVDDFDAALEKHVVGQGWFAEAPSKAVTRWVVRGVLAILGGAGLLFLAFQIPMSGLALVGGALIIGGVILLLLSRAMPAVTMSGAMIRAQLAAYRRTLKKTMEQSRSMDQVVADAGLDWLDTPDQAIVWGTALGLQDEIEEVLERSLEDVKDGALAADRHVLPGVVRRLGRPGVREHRRRWRHLLELGVPNIGGMMAALGTIGNSPSSSGSGGGAASRAAVRAVAAAAGRRRLLVRPTCPIPNSARQRSRPSTSTVGRGRDSHTARVIGTSRSPSTRPPARAGRTRSARSQGSARPRSTPRCRGTPRIRRRSHRGGRTRTPGPRRASPCRSLPLEPPGDPRAGVDDVVDREAVGGDRLRADPDSRPARRPG